MRASVHFIEMVRTIPSQERSEVRIQKIIDAAETLISEKGVSGASMTEIAKLGLSSIGSIYNYFPGKDGLLQALRARQLQELDRRICESPPLRNPKSIEELSSALVDCLVNFSMDFPAYRHLFFSTELEFQNLEDDAKLMGRFKALLSLHFNSLSGEELKVMTETVLLILKGLLDAGKHVRWSSHPQLVYETKRVLSVYLRSRSQ